MTMLLGMDTYSVRSQGWGPLQTLDYAAGLRLQNVQFSERAALGPLDDDTLVLLRRRRDELGLHIEVGMRSIDRFATTFDESLGSGEEQLTEMVRIASTVGSPVVRCFLGMQEDRLGEVPIGQHIAECTRVLRSVEPAAAAAGVIIALENHGGGDLHARELRALVEDVGSPSVGVCFDTGNPLYGGEDAVLAAEILAPYVVTTQVRDTRVWPTATGTAVQWVPAGQGDVDLPRIVDVLRLHAPDIAFNLEIITGHPPVLIDFLAPESAFWRSYPDLPARDFARFLALSLAGTERPLEQLEVEPALSALQDDVRAQQRRHLEESITWCRSNLAGFS